MQQAAAVAPTSVPPVVCPALETLDAAALQRWCSDALAGLTAARVEIDDLNVYPVPDGDTGINLQLTLQSVVDAVQHAWSGPVAADMSATLSAMAHGAVMGARGNSGVIVAEMLKGLAEVLMAHPVADAAALQRALTRAAELGYGAVASPVEGTVLTVAREAAAAAAATGVSSLQEVVSAARTAAAGALARTPDQLPALKAAGVVDAGGRGFCVLLEALEGVVTGRGAQPTVPTVLVPRDRSGRPAVREAGSDDFGYEVQFLLRDTTPASVEELKTRLAELGDSLVVVGGGPSTPGLHNVHVHVNDVGAAIEAGLEAGRPFRVTVTHFGDQIAAQDSAREVSGRQVIAVAPGRGLAELFAAGGAGVVTGGPTANPSTGELLAAIRSGGAHEVVLLPNDGNVLGVANAAADAARQEGRDVTVVHTRSAVQGLAALAVTDPARSFAADVAAMAEAAGSTRWAEVTTAVRESMTTAGVCRPGDVLGLIEGDVAVLGGDVEQVARDLLDRLLDSGGELVTVVTGGQADAGLGERLAAHVRSEHPTAEVVTYAGGQPHYPVLLGVE